MIDLPRGSAHGPAGAVGLRDVAGGHAGDYLHHRTVQRRERRKCERQRAATPELEETS